jgi:lipoprotein-anchoring transpeptidase ErfK/SrfK
MSSRTLPVLMAVATVLAAAPARANVVIEVDKSSQHMSVLVDGVARYQWAVSTARAGYSTPSGTYHPERMERSWFSREYYNSPMPHSIFFHGGYAIHGSYEISRSFLISL